MNPLLNPAIALPFLKNYMTDSTRIERLTNEQLQRYRDKALKRIITYANTVPLYHDKYQNTHLTPTDITGIKDITTLPLVSKNDLRNNYPDRIIPPHYNKDKAFVVCTGGTTGKSVSIYTDFPTLLRAMGPMMVETRYFNLNLRNLHYASVGNYGRYRIDRVMRDEFYPRLRPFYSTKNVLDVDVSTPVKEIMEQLDRFRPDIICTYPTIYQHLAYLKKKGYGPHVQPKYLQVAGDVLDDYTRSYVEDAFGVRLYNVYPSVEAQANIAFECKEGNWHLHSDFFHLEAMDKNNDLVAPGERGHLIITRLWGWGTPIVRYTGMDDWVTLSDDEHCSCGLHSVIMKKPVEGRMRTNIIIPGGKVFPPGAFCYVEPILNDLKTFKVQQYQVVQRKIDQVEILLVIDEDLRNVGAPVEEIKKRIQKAYEEKVGPDVTITVTEVPKIPWDSPSGKPAPIVISYVGREEGYKQLEKE